VSVYLPSPRTTFSGWRDRSGAGVVRLESLIAVS
jgi:hypothetical protein